MAILNDSTGTLMSCAHKNRNCKIGIIIGKRKSHTKQNSKKNYFILIGEVNACTFYF